MRYKSLQREKMYDKPHYPSSGKKGLGGLFQKLFLHEKNLAFTNILNEEDEVKNT